MWRWRQYRGTGWAVADAWEDRPEKIEHFVAQGLFNSTTRMDLRGLTETNLVILDLDMHGEAPAFVRSLRDSYAKVMRKKRVHEHRWRADAARPSIEALQEALPASLLERTARGFHLAWKLSRKVNVRIAALIAEALRALVSFDDERVTCESFPKLDADGTGRLCSLPLLGIHVEVGSDLLPLRKRRAAAEDFVALEGIDVDELLSLLGIECSDPVVASEARPEPPRGHREATEGHLFGSDFAAECRRILTGGFDRGEHYDGTRRVAACLFYVAPTAEVARERFAAFLELPIHRSRHCQSERGKQHMLNDFKVQARHFERGVAEGRCHFDGMRSKWIRAFVARLDGEMSLAA